jgi:hypothetical protein
VFGHSIGYHLVGIDLAGAFFHSSTKYLNWCQA